MDELIASMHALPNDIKKKSNPKDVSQSQNPLQVSNPFVAQLLGGDSKNKSLSPELTNFINMLNSGVPTIGPSKLTPPHTPVPTQKNTQTPSAPQKMQQILPV